MDASLDGWSWSLERGIWRAVQRGSMLHGLTTSSRPELLVKLLPAFNIPSLAGFCLRLCFSRVATLSGLTATPLTPFAGGWARPAAALLRRWRTTSHPSTPSRLHQMPALRLPGGSERQPLLCGADPACPSRAIALEAILLRSGGLLHLALEGARAFTISKTYNAGQVCTSLSQFMVDDSVYDQLVERFLRELKNTKIGNGLLAQSRMAPLATVRRVTAMSNWSRMRSTATVERFSDLGDCVALANASLWGLPVMSLRNQPNWLLK